MEKFVLSLLTSSLTMTAVAFIYMFFLKILRERWSAKWRYYTWALIFAAFLIPYRFSFGSAAVNIDTELRAVTVGNTGYYSLPDKNLDIFTVAFLVWAVGAAVFIIKTLTDQHMFINSVKRLSHPADKAAEALIDKLTDDLSIWQEVKAVKLSEVTTPMIVGFFSPTIILPHREYTESELRLILKHELLHFKSKDLFIKSFMLIAKAVNWFNPFLTLFIRSAEQQCEMYCDERVMEGETEESKRLYCQSILNTALLNAAPAAELKPVLSSNFNISRSGLKQRLKTILSTQKRYSLRIIVALTAALIAMSGTAFAFTDGYHGGNDAYTFETTFAAVSYNYMGQNEEGDYTTYAMNDLDLEGDIAVTTTLPNRTEETMVSEYF